MNWFSTKALNAILAIVISLTLWIVVQLQAQPIDHDFSNVKLDLTSHHPPEGLVVAGDQEPLVKLVAHGPADAVNSIKPEDLKPYVDLSKVPAAVNKQFKVLLDRAAKDKERGIEWTLAPQQIQIDQVAQVDMDVNVVASRALQSPSFRYLNASASPQSVRVTGPKSLVSTVRTARVVLDLETAHPQAVQNLDVEILNRSGTPVEGLTIEPRSVKVTPVIVPADQRLQLFVNYTFNGTQPDPSYRVTGVKVVPAQVQVDVPNGMQAKSLPTTIETKAIDITGLKQTTTFQVELSTVGLRGMRPAVKTVEVTVEISPVTPKSVIP